MCLMNRFQQILLVLLNIGRTLSGYRNTARLTNMMPLLDVAVVNEWRSVVEILSVSKFFKKILISINSWPKCWMFCIYQPRDVKYISLHDGRKLCLECLDSTIMDTNECQPLYCEIQAFYDSLNMKVEQDVPLLLVERQALNEAREGEKHVTKQPL